VTVFSAFDHLAMARALRLAELGLYTTQPNPRVGCVIAQGEQIIGEGWHQRAGEPHAEVFALREAGTQARGATAYVTLEPCAHYGRTPPCADALVAAGIARVVVAHEDPFPRVAGQGLSKLREAGISLDIGLMREAAWELNRGFFSRVQRGRSWVRVKLAMSLDGRTALSNGDSKWISGDAARADVQHWRARSSAIMTSSATVLADNPRLTVRLAEGIMHTNPLRVVLDRKLQTPRDAQVLDTTAPTLMLHVVEEFLDQRFVNAEHACVATLPDGVLDLAAVLNFLAKREINEVQVEAGARLCGALFSQGLVDELLLYIAPVFLGDDACPLLKLNPLLSMEGRIQWRMIEQRQVGKDMRLLLRA